MHQSLQEADICKCGDRYKAFYVDPYRKIQFWYWCRKCDEKGKGRNA